MYGYTLTSDNLSCLKKVSFCEEYATSNKETKELTCYICSEGYYLDETEKKCVQPSDYFSSRCKKYKRNDSQCQECSKNTFVKSISTCEAHDQNVVSPNCVSLSLLDRNVCDECEEGYFLFPAESNCLPLTTLIPNCVVYADEENCSECLTGYYGSQCERIPAELHCLQKDSAGDKCVKCENNYFLDKQSSLQEGCSRPSSIIENYCNEIELDNGLFQCLSCKENMLSMDYINSSYCDTPQEAIPKFCVKMGIRDNKMTCINCEPGYFLKDKACVRQCNFADYVIKFQNIEIQSNKLVNFGQISCVQSPDDLCLVKTYAVTYPSKTLFEVCARCRDSASALIDNQNYKYAHVLDIEYSITAQNHPMIRAPAVTCKDNTAVFKSIFAGTATENCKYFRENQLEYICQRCINGYTGKLKYVVNYSSGIESCDIKVDYCNTEVNFKGANYKAEKTIILENLFSCSSCEGDRIPFIHVQRVSEGNYYLRSYDLSTEAVINTTNDAMGVSIACRNPNNPSDFGVTAPITTFTRSCGLGIINVLETKGSEGFLRCVACLPGFKATYDPSNKDFITNCEKIENCDTTYGFQWFNACSKCTAGFIYGFDDTNNTIQYDFCIQKDQVLHKNCIAAVDGGKCHLCEDGYSLNEDSICEFISAFDCTDNFTNNDYQEGTYGAANDVYDFTLPLVYNFSGKGCSKCETNSRVAMEVGDSNKYFCTPRSYIAFNSFVQNSSFVPNCLRYKGEGNTFSCVQCREEFIINGSFSGNNLTKETCFPYNENLLFCEVADKDDDQRCIQCEENYMLLSSGKCITAAVYNCNKTEVKNGTSVICTECADGYFKSLWGVCVKGSVENCRRFFFFSYNCVECMEGYRLFSDSRNNDYCIKMEDTNCKKWRSTAASDGKFDCEVCIDGFTPSKNTNYEKFRPNMCLGPIFIENCIKYDIDQTSVKTSNFTCHICKDGFYRNGGTCEPRENLDVNCISYERQSDECEECSKEYVISDDSTQCLTNPTGIDNCSSYEDLKTCKVCNKDYYLENNVCMSVATPYVQSNCLEYETETRCSVCSGNNYLDDTKKCQSSSAQHCREFKNEDECVSCIDDYFLTSIPNPQVDERPTIQVCQKETKLANCISQKKVLNAENKYDYYCLQCDANYYLGQSGCEQVTNLITDCMYYSTRTECLYCIPGKVATEDRTACINSFYVVQSGLDVDPSCLQNRISKAPICGFCKAGFINVDSKCTACEVDANCYTCDPNDLKKCILCKPGFYMNAEKSCLPNEVSEDDHDHDHDHDHENETSAEDGGQSTDQAHDHDHSESTSSPIGVWIFRSVVIVLLTSLFM